MIFDTHAHYDSSKYDEDRDELLKNIRSKGVEYIVNVSADLDGCKNTLELIDKYEYIYGSMGIHPSEIKELDEEKFKIVINGLEHNKIVAVGEIGLDYYWDEDNKAEQKRWFERQIELAKERKLPIIIHSREAAKDTLDIVKACNAKEAGGVVHCFSYGKEMAREYLNMGFYLGIGGVLTFNNARKLVEVVEYMPLDRLVLETDAPYLAPVPYRGKRNSSEYLSYVVDKISEIKGISKDEVENVTTRNAFELYKINNK